jgi:hypothetical protein
LKWPVKTSASKYTPRISGKSKWKRKSLQNGDRTKKCIIFFDGALKGNPGVVRTRGDYL